ncbi:uncharacterized protein LOC130815786 [Amaranthus tricolor]|uniref:uncharacterized protein LOC130815786 n=1 Tax=Amaranthus tricolor TaxID=29722 RepID=UPI002583F6AE|nr:uncharacterized protein LOC130815786 [Amaranthus tricolor]
MTIALSGKNKLRFVDGSLARLTNNSAAKAWDMVDNVVMGWIIAVLEDSIANSILSYKTSKDIWDEINERYGQSSNAQMFSLQEELNALTQTTDLSISDFFIKIKNLWDEFDGLNPIPTCSCNATASGTCNVAKKIFKMQKNSKVISFLMKLDKRYKQVRSNMLMMHDFPTATQAYRILLQEETHLQLSTSGGNINDSMACRVEKLKFQDKGSNRYNITKSFKSKRPSLWCDHCKMNGHTKGKC